MYMWHSTDGLGLISNLFTQLLFAFLDMSFLKHPSTIIVSSTFIPVSFKSQ